MIFSMDFGVGDTVNSPKQVNTKLTVKKKDKKRISLSDRTRTHVCVCVCRSIVRVKIHTDQSSPSCAGPRPGHP